MHVGQGRHILQKQRSDQWPIWSHQILVLSSELRSSLNRSLQSDTLRQRSTTHVEKIPPLHCTGAPDACSGVSRNCDGAVFCSLGGIVIPCGAQLRVDIVGSIYGYNCISCFLVDNC